MRFAALILAAVLVLSPAAEAKRSHGKKGKRENASVRFKVKKHKRARKEKLKRVGVPRAPGVIDHVPLGPPVVRPPEPAPVRTDAVFYCLRYLLVDGDLAYVCGEVGRPTTECTVTEADGTSRRPCPPGVPPNLPGPLP